MRYLHPVILALAAFIWPLGSELTTTDLDLFPKPKPSASSGQIFADSIPGTTQPLSETDIELCQSFTEYDFDITDLNVTGSGNRVRITIRADVPPREAEALSYQIERSKNGESFTLANPSYSPAYFYPYAEFIDDDLELGSSYSYRITPLVDGRPSGSPELASVSLSGRVFYFATNGNDGNNGRSPNTPLRSVNQLRGMDLRPGDLIRLRAGDVFDLSNELYLDAVGSGTAKNPIVITSYGSGKRPHLRARGANRVLNLRNVQHFHLDNLAFSGARGAQIDVFAYRSDMHGLKFLRIVCDGDASRDKKACLVFNAENARVLGPPANQKFHIYDVEVANSEFLNAGGGESNSDGVRFWAVRNDGHVHHCTFLANSGQAMDIAGGRNHIFEYNYIDGSGISRAAGTKAHGQRYPLKGTVYRFNIIRNCNRVGISLEDSQDGLIYHNTIDQASQGFGAVRLYGKNRPDQIRNNRVYNNVLLGGRDDYGPITIYINGAPTDSYGLFKDFIVDYMGLDWRNDKETYIDHNLLDPRNGCVIRYVYRRPDLSFAQDYPENSGNNVPVCVPPRDFGSRWQRYHPNDRIAQPSFNGRSSMRDYRLKPGSPGEGMAKDIRGIVGENLRDFANQPILYTGSASNPGAYAYSGN